MNERIKKIVTSILIFGMVLGFTGCGSSGANGTSGSIGSSASSATKEKISIKDIPWKVEEGIIDGGRFALFNYTNNSQYPITELEINFTEKPGLSDEDKNKFYSFLQSEAGVSDEDIEKFKKNPITMRAEVKELVNPGDSVSNKKLLYYHGYRYVLDISHYNMVEPDIVTIKYIDDGKIYTEYYDYRSKKYSNESKTKVAYQWSDRQLGNKIPRPKVDAVEFSNDSERYYAFDAYGMSLEKFNAYVEECEKLGYTIDVDQDEGHYRAYNNEGYRILLDYNENNHSMDGSVDAPSTEKE